VKLVESVVKKLDLTKYLRKKVKVLREEGNSIRLVMNYEREVFVMHTSNKDSLSTAQVERRKK